jgi:molecular chaperone GrpE
VGEKERTRRKGSGEGTVSPAESGSTAPSRPPSSAPDSSSKPESGSTGPAPTPSVAPAPSPSTPPPNGEEEERVERDLSDLLTDVERERDEYLELARRTKADFENYRRRVAGEAAEAERRGRAELARALIPVLDNLERALAAMEPRHDEEAASQFAEGVRLVREELAAVLKRSGVESFEPAGEPFDPHLHEAMMTRPTTAEEAGKVLEVLEKGYRLNGQVLRPARVIVGERGS